MWAMIILLVGLNGKALTAHSLPGFSSQATCKEQAALLVREVRASDYTRDAGSVSSVYVYCAEVK